jgi:dTDP-4-dehydrorhamnose reductase
MIKVALLGAGGQLGSDVAITKPPTVQLYPLTRKEMDIKDRKSILKALRDLKAHVVINAAAYVNVDGAEEEYAEAFQVNAFGARHVAEACADTGASLLHVSTDYVFDGTRSIDEGSYREDAAPAPLNTYGLSKYTGEQFVRNTTDRHYIVRSASLFGKAGAHSRGGNFVFSILKKAKTGEPLKVVDDIVMSPTGTADLALYIWEIIWKAYDYGIYHAVNEGSCSWYDFACAIVGYAGLKTEIVPISYKDYPFRARRPLRTPLATHRHLVMRPWRRALEDFIDTLQ